MAEVDDTGWFPETQGEREGDLDAAMLSEFPPVGNDFLDLTPDSYTGRSNGIIAEFLVSSENLVADFLDILDPAQAQGPWVDYHLRLQATRRKKATFSTIAARLEGLPGTLVGDKRVRYTPNGTVWRTPVNGSDGNPLVIKPNGITDDISLTAADSGPIDAVETGTTSWIIVDEVVGWSTVESTARAGLGTTVEADSTARARLAKPSTAALGSGTKPGIEKRLLGLDGVTDAAVNNNRKLIPENGIPGKSVEAIVEGGDPQTICNTILSEYKGTTGYFGNTFCTASVSFTLEDGTAKTVTEDVYYTVPERVQIIARYTISYGKAAEAPDDLGVAIALEKGAAYINDAGRDVDVLPAASASAIEAALPPASEPVVVGEVAIKGLALGFVNIPISVRQVGFTDPTAQAAIVTGTVVETFNFIVTWVLVVSVDAAAPITVTFSGTDFDVISAARALEVATVIAEQVDALNAGVDEGAVEMASKTVGAASSIEILGSTSAGLLAALGLLVDTVNGSDGDVEIVIA